MPQRDDPRSRVVVVWMIPKWNHHTHFKTRSYYSAPLAAPTSLGTVIFVTAMDCGFTLLPYRLLRVRIRGIDFPSILKTHLIRKLFPLYSVFLFRGLRL